MKYFGITLALAACICCNAQSIIYPSDAIVRNIEQDRKGDIWIASFDGVFKYDGKSFKNITDGVSTARFFSVLEDTRGNLWFGSIGSGVYRYDGKSFKQLTINDGLLNNEVTCIFEDKAGNIWFGVNGGTSCYDGKSFRNYTIEIGTMVEDKTGKTLPDVRPPNEVNSIIEDKNGKLWFATRGNTYIYDKTSFRVVAHEGTAFVNVRTLIEDQKGNVWLGGTDGLWRFDGKSFTNFKLRFVGYIHEDRKGNLWTSSGSVDGRSDWQLSRYDVKYLSSQPVMPETISKEGAVFGVLEAKDGSIWFGTADGVKRYDGKVVDDFKP